ncbi:cytochrome c biogenesis heme-transporting ATPase CcmA [Methylothermus subterraneus]
MTQPLLYAANLECVRGDRLLFRGLSFCLDRGQLLHIQGANGCGKTSLLRMVCGLSAPAAGEIYWRGRPIGSERHRLLQELAYLGHHLGVKGELSALENLTLASRLYRTRQGADPRQLLNQAGLGGCMEIPARSLSAGQRQRIALARLLLQEAVLWVLDEPFTALDQSGVAWVQSLLEEHLGRGGLVVMTSHQPVSVGFDVVTLKL